MREQPGWQRLQCDNCQGEKFVAVFHLKWSPTGGLVREPAGEQCISCRNSVDAAKLIEHAKIKQKKAELAALQEQIGDT